MATTGVRRRTMMTTHGARISSMVIRTTNASTLRSGSVPFGFFNYLSMIKQIIKAQAKINEDKRAIK